MLRHGKPAKISLEIQLWEKWHYYKRAKWVSANGEIDDGLKYESDYWSYHGVLHLAWSFITSLVYKRS